MVRSTQDPVWLRKARSYLGVKEYKGAKHHHLILSFFALAGHGWVKKDEVPWCAAFTNAVLEQCHIKGTKLLTARSFLKWGQKIKKPRKGCIAIFRRGQSNWQGHVGFVISESEKHIKLLGGNQADKVSIALYPKARLLGLRWPNSLPSKNIDFQPSHKTRTALHLRTRPQSLGGKSLLIMPSHSLVQVQESWSALSYEHKGKLYKGWASNAYLQNYTESN